MVKTAVSWGEDNSETVDLEQQNRSGTLIDRANMEAFLLQIPENTR